MWGVAGATRAAVLLRIEDHDRQRCRPEYDAALLDDLAWLGFVADEGPVRQSTPDAAAAYDRALGCLRAAGIAYACRCSRADFSAAGFAGAGCPLGCRAAGLADGAGVALRAALGDGTETWTDGLVGEQSAAVAPHGDLAIRDRHGNWTYSFAVVVDDLRQDVDLVVRGADLLDATGPQIRLGRLLGRQRPAAFVHHPLVRKASGAKLSKADGDTSIRDLRRAGASPGELLGRAAEAVGLIPRARPLAPDELPDLVRGAVP